MQPEISALIHAPWRALVDVAEAWIKTQEITKTDRLKSAVANGTDTLAGWCAPAAERWDASATRRDELRTPEHLKGLMKAQREYNSARVTARSAAAQRRVAKSAHRGNPLAGPRRAARTADKAAKQSRHKAESELMAARELYPKRLVRRVSELHAAHVAPTVGSSVALTMWQGLTVWPVSMSAAVIAANITVLKLGRRAARLADVEGDLTAEERRLTERLDPSYWVPNADVRGLSGTVPTPAEVTPAGLVSHVRLDGKWTAKSLAAQADSIRALIGARTDLRMEITAGTHGDRAMLTVRTRNAAEDVDLTGWQPGDAWGVDTVTGEPVMVPLGRRMLIAGTSGSGKSWSTRALLAEASETEDHRLVVIDPKRVEAINWEHRARIAISALDVLDVTDDLVEEMHERLEAVPRGQDVIQISKRRPRITVFIDEGAEVITMARKKRAPGGGKDEPGDPDWSRIMENLGTLARMARAAEIILIWATQKPTMDTKGGIDPQISAQITYRAALALSTSAESRVVFGEDATERGWHAHDLPMPGVAMLRSGPKAKPHPIRTRAFSPKAVIALPNRPIWRRGGAAAAVTPPPVEQEVERPSLRLVKAQAPPETAAPAGPVTNRDKVMRAIQAGARTGREVTDQTGIHKGTVSRELKTLVESGAVRRTEDGALVVGEVSA